MRSLALPVVVALLLATGALADVAHAIGPAVGFQAWRARRLDRHYADNYTWHGRYYNAAYGSPVAVVTPPTVTMQTDYGWGVGNTRISRIPGQFGNQYPGRIYGNTGFWPTPPWPRDTTQYGLYHVRGPW